MASQITIPLRDFSVDVLPASARTPGSQEFRDAVVQYLTGDFASRGLVALVTMDALAIYVAGYSSVQEAFTLHILPMLRQGQLRAATSLLEQLTKGHPPDAMVLYNLGIAYSEQKQYAEAIIRLKRAVQLDPTHAHAWVGIGTAYERMGRLDMALPALQEAARLDPNDGYSNRNLGGVLAQLGRVEEAVKHLQRAYELLPEDPMALYGLAKTLQANVSDPEAPAKADKLLATFLQRFPSSPMAEEAREARTRFAHQTMRAASPGGLRMDVVFYILGALQLFAAEKPQKCKEVALEIALLGRKGLNINDSSQQYPLKSLPGSFTGMHLVALLYTAMKDLDPSADSGVDFSQEYAMAQSLWAQQKKNRPT
jgi:tetratricopeptide (TPR) repeat protein